MAEENTRDETQTKESDPRINKSSIVLPKFKSWDSKKLYDYSEDVTDYSTFEELENVFIHLRRALFMVNDKINEYERRARLAKVKYDRHHRREYLTSTERTESAKRARADLACEELENEWLMNEQLKEEMIRTSFTLKSEMQTLTTMAHNMRAQIKNF